ncbi:Polysulphide reductase, NrfD [Pseudonocardia ammonioxydans]|uniref:Polysulphide reductase, NrfD n=1 Tax=Pseudonocardia ammonioxydans TaxID=260086 RepID=A0A1I5FAS0_PSUAM|nr:NrfD/PsrC family molybdoenzyme membrane anchor subunit [Pseudonocardia ammonioxydans]SFO20854.1 Polysulphide reductase, NrfD [Pseudonocardia ammonioxydans]
MTAQVPAERRRRSRGGRGEQLMVPDADFRSYHDRPIIKPPVWKVPDVPAYLYLGGTAGVAASLAALADLTGRAGLRRSGRLVAAGGAVTSVAFLIHDLGRPERFLNMMRVIKPTSPLSVGSWILAPFGTATGAAAASEVTGLLPGAGRVAGLAGGVLGPAMTTYTAVLLADTAVPGWHEAYRELPFVFAGSALAAGGGSALVAGHGDGPPRRVAVAGAALELAATHRLETAIGMSAHAYRTGRAGRVLRAARAATVAGVAAALAGPVVDRVGRRSPRRRRLLDAAAGLLLNAGSAATRWGVFDAGMATAWDPAYTVVPQRERLAAREAGDGSAPGATVDR